MQDRGRCVIFCASPECAFAPVIPGDYVIACDGGLKHALTAGVTPDIAIGDFDSYTGVIPDGLKVIHVPVEKDDTDLMLAVKSALSIGYSDFLLLGALGGRLDHAIANIAAGAYIAERAGRCELIGLNESVYVFKGSMELRGMKGRCVSVFAFGDKADGVTISGMKYALNDATLTGAFPLGVSNVVESDTARVEAKRGTLFVIINEGDV